MTGKTDFHRCCFFGDLNTVQRFIDEGVDINLPDDSGNPPLHLSVGGSGDEKGVDNFEIAKLLIEKGADINQQDGRGCTALHVAAGLGLIEFIELLLENKADKSLCNNRGHAPFKDSESAKLYLSNRRVDIIADTGAYRTACQYVDDTIRKLDTSIDMLKLNNTIY